MLALSELPFFCQILPCISLLICLLHGQMIPLTKPWMDIFIPVPQPIPNRTPGGGWTWEHHELWLRSSLHTKIEWKTYKSGLVGSENYEIELCYLRVFLMKTHSKPALHKCDCKPQMKSQRNVCKYLIPGKFEPGVCGRKIIKGNAKWTAG